METIKLRVETEQLKIELADFILNHATKTSRIFNKTIYHLENTDVNGKEVSQVEFDALVTKIKEVEVMMDYANKSFKAKNPYFTHGKPLPFEIGDKTFAGTYKVYTVEYKGKKRIDVYTEYSKEAIEYLINKGTIKEVL